MQGGNDYSYMISVMASSSLLMRQSHHLATIMFFAAAYHGRRRRRRRRRRCLVGAASRLSVVIFMPARQPMPALASFTSTWRQWNFDHRKEDVQGQWQRL